jgi:phosphate transport system permease protein
MQKVNLQEFKEKTLSTIYISIAVFSSFLLLAMVLFILRECWPIWSEVGIIGVLSGTAWRPLNTPPQIGIAPMLVSTLWVAGGALLIAAPLGFGCAIFLAEFAPAPLAVLLRPVLNMLTGIPSVVYGFLGAAVLTKFFELQFDLASGESLFAASLILSIMVIPFIVTNSEVALRSVAPEYRHAGIALGVSRQYLTLRVLVPLARKGMLGALVLAFGRAMGETMAVLMLAGNTLQLPSSWFDKGEPLSALIALELGSAVPGSTHYQALFAAGLVLVLLVMAVNLGINLVMHRLQRGVELQ